MHHTLLIMQVSIKTEDANVAAASLPSQGECWEFW